MHRKPNLYIKVIFLALLVAVGFTPAPRLVAQASKPSGVPTFEVDASWPKLPDQFLTGEIGAMTVDAQDHIWLAHRPGKLGKAEYNPANLCCKQAPPIMEFNMAGNYIQGWGGPGEGYSWSEELHGIFVDHKDNVWICASFAGPEGKDKSTTLPEVHTQR